MRKKKKKTIFKNKFILWGVISIVGLIVIGTAFVTGYIVAKNSIKPKVIVKKDIQAEKALKELQKLVDENINKNSPVVEKKSISKNLKKKKTTSETVSSEAMDYDENNKDSKKEIHNVVVNKVINKTVTTNKPKLVIIMDDMSFASQVKNLKNLHMKITPSFFPPTYNHPYTAKYAKEFKHYMVHFPMQATNPNFHEEPKTLHIDSNYNFIENRVVFIKKNFPNLKFINNHTGSKFTSDLASMKKLYKALDKYNLIFIDSVTTSKTKAPIVAKENHKILLQRDIFLDNISNVNYIHNQLKKAVQKAKKHGYAIAICHPHKSTFEALKTSKNILKDVELIYIGQMYDFAKKHHLSRL